MWEDMVMSERMGTPGAFAARKQYYIFLGLVGDEKRSARLRQELEAMRAIR